jgi:uncharacterized delta-60 repeat protein
MVGRSLFVGSPSERRAVMARKLAILALLALCAALSLLPGRPAAASEPVQATAIVYPFGSALSTQAGDLDPTFDGDGKVITDFGKNEFARGMAIQPDSKIVVVGGDTETNPPQYYRDFVLARYLSDGRLDPAFGGGRVRTDFAGGGSDHAYGVVQQPDGKLVVAGWTADNVGLHFGLVRYNGDSSLDPTFDGDGKAVVSFGGRDGAAYAVALQPDGRIVAAGVGAGSASSDFALARLNINGSLDASFDGDGYVLTDFSGTDDVATSVAVEADGKIIVAGVGPFPSRDVLLARYEPNGHLDASFEGDGKVTTSVPCCVSFGPRLAVQSDGKIVVAAGPELLRYNADGSLDSRFGTAGRVSVVGRSEAVTLQRDGRIIVGETQGDGLAVSRYMRDGSEDFDFNSNVVDVRAVDRAVAVALQSDRKIVLAGSTGTPGPPAVLDFIVLRFLNPAPPPPPPRCRVPNVRGKKLPVARSAITKAHCKVGKVRRKTSKKVKRGRVISQRPKPRTTLPNRGKVNLVVSRGRG